MKSNAADFAAANVVAANLVSGEPWKHHDNGQPEDSVSSGWQCHEARFS